MQVQEPFRRDKPKIALDFLTWAREELISADSDALTIMRNRDKVLGHFGPLFRERSNKISEEEISAFLDFESNCHWTGLHRQKPAITSDMPALRKAITLLVKRSASDADLEDRFNRANDGIRGFGEGIITPILFVSFPQEYGVWNSKSEFALSLLGMWPPADRGDTKGRTYYKVNNALIACRSSLNAQLPTGQAPVDLWTIDYYWHALKVMSEDGRLTNLLARFQARKQPC